MTEGPFCACLRVQYAPIHNPDGTNSERWECAQCGAEFVRGYRLQAENDRLQHLLSLTPTVPEDLAEANRLLVKERDALRLQVARLQSGQEIESDYIDELQLARDERDAAMRERDELKSTLPTLPMNDLAKASEAYNEALAAHLRNPYADHGKALQQRLAELLAAHRADERARGGK